MDDVVRLTFADGSPVRAASAVARLGDGWLIAQDDATHAAWWRADTVVPVRLLPPIDERDVFEDASGTKHLKPDLEAACEVDLDGHPAVVLLGSGSSPQRMRAALVSEPEGRPEVVSADLSPLYAVVADALAVTPDQLNLEGACIVGPLLRWFHRGMPSAGSPTASVDLDVATLIEAVRGQADPDKVPATGVLRYDLGAVAGVGLAATDAVMLTGSGPSAPTIAVSAAAEDTDDPRDDGPVVGSALVLVRGTDVVASAAFPEVQGRLCKVEGLALVEQAGRTARLLATVDADDHRSPSVALRLSIRW